MFYQGFVKRFLPFVLTFAAGLFLASFFVSIALPALSSGDRRPRRQHECRKFKREFYSLREENLRLKAELEARRGTAKWEETLENAVPPVALEAPQPPSLPRTHRSYEIR